MSSPRSRWFAVATLAIALTTALFLSRASAQPAAPGGGPQDQMHAMHELLGLIDQFGKITASPSTTGVAAVMASKDRFKNPADAIAFLEKALPNVKDAAVRRAIRVQLGELYKNSGNQEKSLEQLEKLIVDQP